MEASKASIKGVERKLAEEEEGGSKKDMSNELANLNKLADKKELPVIKIQEKDINFLQSELDITFEEAKFALIKYQGDVKQVIDNFLEDFNFQ
ncbi:MAG: hypothetical protein MJ252_22235 [archaeon]|nr:hypothetical protein [archaeon]